ncbi:MAG: putative MPP superfamily phosphohydrolase [Saprospiraceae bacterium]|jgi:predicted MPP superfamily phosphohydrolase|uniref:metallophosphoesterase n=1 Tax=Patiriisocius sp. Uisw_047 TaxID=3230969 RepID=UPI0039E96FC3
MLRWIIPIVIYILIDIYAYQAFRTLWKGPIAKWIYFGVSAIVLGLIIYQLVSSGGSRRMSAESMYVFGIFIAFFVPKLLLIIFMFGEDIIRLFVGAFMKFGGDASSFHMPERRKFVSTIALGIAAIPFASLIYGMVRGKYNYKVHEYTLEFDNLPAAFNGYRVTQISDVHSGSFTNEEKIKYAVDLVNEQKSDVILFTGDLVNNLATEMDAWKGIFGSLTATDGVFSVLGNHDYGDYVSWETPEEKIKNLDDLKMVQKEMGWDLLLNEHRTITKNGESIKLVGVENWGIGGFKKAGDLDKACEGVEASDFKILLSHDPSHWQEQVKSHPKNIELTLSGHTHGMQFGIEIPGLIKWSPIKYRYENWAGIYEELGSMINVNRGFGYLAYPGRVGIWPEISVITLKTKGSS